MKILCLHGSYGSASHFQVQMSPFVSVIEKPGEVDFEWIDGGHDAKPPKGFENYFGAPPHYRFINFDGISAMDDTLEKIREMPDGLSSEEAMRSLIGEEEAYTTPAVVSTLGRLIELIDADPEIEGLMGYSEGATVSASLILEERRLFEEEGRPRRIKFGIFFAGWPPIKVIDGNVKCLLADECEDMLDVPTCHIVGCNDPYIHGSMALYSMCDEDTAVLFDHGKGHTVPRDARTIEELSAAIKTTVAKGTCV